MENKNCENLIDLYNNLLSEKNNFYILSKSGFDRENIKEMLVIINNTKQIQNNIDFIFFGEYKKEKIGASVFYEKCFDKKIDFRGVRVPEKPKLGKWKLLFIDSSLVINPKKIIEKIIEIDGSHVAASSLFFFDDGKMNINWDIEVEHEPERVLKNEPYAIWVEDIKNSMNVTLNNVDLIKLSHTKLKEKFGDRFMTFGECLLFFVNSFYENKEYPSGWTVTSSYSTLRNVTVGPSIIEKPVTMVYVQGGMLYFNGGHDPDVNYMPEFSARLVSY